MFGRQSRSLQIASGFPIPILKNKKDILNTQLFWVFGKIKETCARSCIKSKFISPFLNKPKLNFAQFHLLFKIHKTPVKTGPIISVSGSFLHGFGI